MAAIDRPQRWDKPFDHDMTNDTVDRVLSIPPFSRMDPTRFSPSASLRDIIRNDTRLVQYQSGDIVVREGDYGSSAFFIMSGALHVVIDGMPASVLGRRDPKRKGFFDILAQTWNAHKGVEVRGRATSTARGSGSRGSGTGTRVFLQDVPAVLNEHKTVRLEAGEFFGEIAALGRIPRTATVFADGPAELLEIRWQGLRDLRARVEELRQHIDQLYRERSLKIHLRETPIFSHLSEDALTEVANQTIFETYGNFDWHTTYKTLAEASAANRLDREPIIVEEGFYPNGLFLIRSGFARVSQRFGNGHRTLSYLGRGHTYGFDEIVHNWRHDNQTPYHSSLRAIGYVDVLIVPTSVIERDVLGPDRERPLIPTPLIPPPIPPSEPAEPASAKQGEKERLYERMIELLVENRFINGTATMIIDLDRCTRCDDCVRACATAHDNNPRFIRHGQQFGHYMVANACMHCADPVCMIGCPTGAIHRNAFQGQVIINDATCIGCATCANSCPYHNIRMVEIRDAQGAFILDRNTNTPIMQATKCDLCVDQMGGPACQRACPHDALRRVDLHNNPESLVSWISR